eukprot:351226-Chlamydomonas_euryale.AAC.9
MPCHAMPCHAMPCHAMPCHAVPCRSVLYDVPWHAMPCRSMPRKERGARITMLCREHAVPCGGRSTLCVAHWGAEFLRHTACLCALHTCARRRACKPCPGWAVHG